MHPLSCESWQADFKYIGWWGWTRVKIGLDKFPHLWTLDSSDSFIFSVQSDEFHIWLNKFPHLIPVQSDEFQFPHQFNSNEFHYLV